MIGVIALSYLLAALYYFFVSKRPEPTWAYFFFIYAYMWIPGLYAWFQAKKEKIELPFRCSFLTFLKTGILSGLLSFLSIFVGAFFYDWNPLFIQNVAPSILSLVFYFLFGLILGPFLVLGQEMMWRGVLHAKFKHLGSLKASAAIGLIWGIWYIPLILHGYNYPGHPILGILCMILLTLSVSPLLYYLREIHHSIWASTAFHGMFNTLLGVAFFVFASPNYMIVGPTGIIGVVLYALASTYALKKLKR